jgi:hypothetical protein
MASSSSSSSYSYSSTKTSSSESETALQKKIDELVTELVKTERKTHVNWKTKVAPLIRAKCPTPQDYTEYANMLYRHVCDILVSTVPASSKEFLYLDLEVNTKTTIFTCMDENIKKRIKENQKSMREFQKYASTLVFKRLRTYVGYENEDNDEEHIQSP